MLLHVLAHVDADERVVVAEHELGQRLGEKRLADAAGAEEQEAAHRPVRVLQTAPRPADRLADRVDRLVLRNDPLVQLVLQFQQAIRLFLFEARQRHAGHLADDLGDDFLVDHAVHFLGLLTPGPLHLLLLGPQPFGLVAELGGLLVLGVLDRVVLLDAQALDLLFEFGQVRRLGHAAQANPRARLVDDVDRLVRQRPAADVAARQFHGRLQRLVGDAHAVVVLVTLAQTLQNLHRVLLVRLLDGDRLEPAGQGGVLLDVLAVLVERRRADALNLAAGEGGLQHVARVDRAFRAAGANQRVQLVDEQDDVLGAAHLVHHGLDPLLKLPAVLRAGDHHRQVEHDDPPVVEDFGNLVADDHLGQALDDGRLADAGLAEQDGVVLLPAAENLHDPLDLRGAADHRVQRLLARQLRQIAAEAVQGRRLALALLAVLGAARPAAAGGHGLFLALDARAEQVQDLLADLFELEAEVHQNLRGHAIVLAEQTEQKVLGADVVVVEVAGLLDGVLDDLLGPRRLRELAHRDHFGAALDELFDLDADLAQVDVEVF